MKFQTGGEGLGSEHFLKLKAGEVIRGVFRGDPHEFRLHWENNKSSLCTDDTCERCKSGNKSKFRFRLNFLVKENDHYVAKIWEQGWTVYTQLRDLHASDYDLEKTVVKITRTGSGLNDTIYSVLPLPPPNGLVTKELNDKLSQIKLHDLVNLAESTPESHVEPGPGHFTESDIPF